MDTESITEQINSEEVLGFFKRIVLSKLFAFLPGQHLLILYKVHELNALVCYKTV